MHEKGLDGVRKSVRIPTRLFVQTWFQILTPKASIRMTHYDVRDDVFRQSKAEEQKSLRDDSVVLKISRVPLSQVREDVSEDRMEKIS